MDHIQELMSKSECTKSDLVRELKVARTSIDLVVKGGIEKSVRERVFDYLYRRLVIKEQERVIDLLGTDSFIINTSITRHKSNSMPLLELNLCSEYVRILYSTAEEKWHLKVNPVEIISKETLSSHIKQSFRILKKLN